jgi:hypothetical protein
VCQAYDDMLASLRRLGVEHRPSETPMEFARAASGVLPRAEPAIWRVVDTHALLTYGGRPPAPAHAQRAAQALEEVRSAVREARRK